MPKRLREQSPYRALRQYEKRILKGTDERMFVVYRDFIRTFLRVRPDSKRFKSELRKARQFRIEGKIFINPKTGKPLKKREWDEIKRSLDTVFNFIYDEATEAAIAKRAVVLGRILTTMDHNATLNVPQLDREASVDYSYLANEIEFAQQQAGELIVGLTENAKKRVISEIIQGQRERVGAKELETRLFDTFINVNRDWRRIAETEVANNVNNGYMRTEIDKGTRYLKGNSGADACPWCKANVDGQVVVIGDQPNQTGFVFDKQLDMEVPYVWPGKSNYSRNRKNWWISAGAQHVHCRCAWQSYTPGFSKYHDELEAKLSALEESVR